MNQTMPTVGLMIAVLMHEEMPQNCLVMLRLSISVVVGERQVEVKFVITKVDRALRLTLPIRCLVDRLWHHEGCMQSSQSEDGRTKGLDCIMRTK